MAEVNSKEFEQSLTTDLTLVVEGKKLFVNKGILMVASPVFAKMLTAEFKEKDASEIDLPGKKVLDIVAFLRCIYPDIMDEIDSTNVYQVLHLADEYQCRKLKQKCENYLVKLVSKTTNLKTAMKGLTASCTYGLQRLLEVSAGVLSDRYLSTLEKHWEELPAEGRLMLCMKRIQKLEEVGTELHNGISQFNTTNYNKCQFGCRSYEALLSTKQSIDSLKAEWTKANKGN